MYQPTENIPWFLSIMYHRVVDRIETPDPYHLSITAQQLDAQLSYLKAKGYESVHPLTAIENARNPQRKKQVVLTFDDGYTDFMTHALPVLQKHDYSAMAMIVSGQISGRNVWDAGRAEQLTLMGPADIKEARSAGIWIGSHSKTHPAMGRLDADSLRSEATDSRRTLEDLLGEPIPVFCFPYGSQSELAVNAVKEAGYEAAFGIEQRQHDLFGLTRVDGVKANGAGLNWRLRVSGGHYRLRNRGAQVKRMLRQLKP